MRRVIVVVVAAALAACSSISNPSESSIDPVARGVAKAAAPVAWDLNATIIEACSCPMFCQCYFNSRPAGVGCCSQPDDPLLATRYCRFNNAFRVNRGTYGDTKLDGLKFWVAGDLGADFSDGVMGWAYLHFEPSASEAQRAAISAILGHVYPVGWESFNAGKDAAIEWNAGRDRSVARLDGGKAAEVILKRNQGMTDEPIVIHNLKYWGVPRNDGFVLMANEVEAYRATDRPFEFKGTNGFMITIDINSADAAAAKKSAP